MIDAAWRMDEVDGVRLLRCTAIESIPGIAHAFSTRVASGSADFDLGPAERESPIVRARRLAFMRAAGFGAARPAILRQVHGAVIVDATPTPARPAAADGVIRVPRIHEDEVVPSVRTADCVAVLLVDRRAAALAALHAGWRGVAAGIGTGAVARFTAVGVAPRDLVAVLGPAIRPCCFEVGEEVVRALSASCGAFASYVHRSPSGRAMVDLHTAIRSQLVAAGVPAGSVHTAPLCTRCRTDLFFSCRAEGPATGRLMAAVGPAAGP
jgi:hypothetical protein